MPRSRCRGCTTIQASFGATHLSIQKPGLISSLDYALKNTAASLFHRCTAGHLNSHSWSPYGLDEPTVTWRCIGPFQGSPCALNHM